MMKRTFVPLDTTNNSLDDPSYTFGQCAWCGTFTICQSGYLICQDRRGKLRGHFAWCCMSAGNDKDNRHTGNPVFVDQKTFDKWARKHPRLADDIMRTGGPKLWKEENTEKRGYSRPRV